MKNTTLTKSGKIILQVTNVLIILFLPGIKIVAGEAQNALKVIEAEDLKLASAKIVEDKNASSGKAIKLLAENSTASVELKLPKGQYAANVIINADDFERDGFYLIADKKVKRTASGHHHNMWVYGTKFIIFESDGKTPVNFQIAAACKCQPNAEFGMLVDRIEIIKYEKSAEVMDKWTGLNFSI